MARKCPHCGIQVGKMATTCWDCKSPLDTGQEVPYDFSADKNVGPGLLAAGIVMIVASVLYFLARFLLAARFGESYSFHFLDLLALLGFVGGSLSLMRISYVGTSICCLLSGVSIAIFFALYIELTTIGSFVLILMAAALIFKFKNEFRGK